MPKQERCIAIWITLAFAAALSTEGPANADQPPDYHGQMIVENVWATPARAGGRSILRLRIINEGHDHAHLLGVETPLTSQTQIVGRMSDHKTVTFDSISVRADSDLDLTTDHMWIELGPLTHAVEAGSSITLDLVFLRGRVRVEAHVHGADG